MNKTILGDSLKILKNVASESIDLIVTDPPYGMSFQSNHRKEKHLKIENDDTLEWLDDFMLQAQRVLKKTHIFTVFVRGIILIYSNKQYRIILKSRIF